MDNLIRKKVLLLLLGGFAIGFSTLYSRRTILRTLSYEWRKIKREGLQKEVKNLYRSKLIQEKKNPDGSFTFVLSDKGRVKALTYHFEGIKIETKDWDGKWRVVFFDVPEKYRWGRDSLRKKLREVGFCELQKSVFIFPYHCEDEIDFIIEYYGMRKYVRYAVIDYIDNDAHLKSNFQLK